MKINSGNVRKNKIQSKKCCNILLIKITVSVNKINKV